jgi:hypothetical protein
MFAKVIGVGMEITLEALKTVAAEKTLAAYEQRLTSLKKGLPGKTWEWILTHPDESYAALSERVKAGNTRANYLTAVCTLMKVHPKFVEAHEGDQEKWKKYLKENRTKEYERYSTNKLSEKQKQNMVEWEEVVEKVRVLKADPSTHQTMRKHLQYLLLSTMLSTTPKRADLGNLKIVKRKPAEHDTMNYLLMGKTPVLVINIHKTRSTHGPIIDPLTPEYAAVVRDSLERYPREYLFISSEGKPYVLNNSYTAFVRATFSDLFDGRKLGVSLWRHVFVSEKMDFNAMQQKEIVDAALKMGTSVSQQMLVYKYTPAEKEKLKAELKERAMKRAAIKGSEEEN